jgi:hypothetical protein
VRRHAEPTLQWVDQGSAWEIRFTTPPKLSMLDGYLTRSRR